jgi:hypothetical protein
MTGAALINAGGELIITLVALGSYALPAPLAPVYGIRIGGPGLVDTCCLTLYVQAVDCATREKVDVWFVVGPRGKVNASVIEDGVPNAEELDGGFFFEINGGDGTVYFLPPNAPVSCTHGTMAGDIVISEGCPTACTSCGSHQTPLRVRLKLAGIQLVEGMQFGHALADDDHASPYFEIDGAVTLGGGICLCWVGGCTWQRVQVPLEQPTLGGSFPMLLIQEGSAADPIRTYSLIFEASKSGTTLRVRVWAAMWNDFELSGGPYAGNGRYAFDGSWPTLLIFDGSTEIGPLCDDRDGYVVNNDYEEWSLPDDGIIGKKGTIEVVPGLGDDDCDEHCPFDCCLRYRFVIGGAFRAVDGKREPYVSADFTKGSFFSPLDGWTDGGSSGAAGASLFRRRGRWVALLDVTDPSTSVIYRLRLLGGDSNCPPTSWTVDAVVASYDSVGGTLDPPGSLTKADFDVIGTGQSDCPRPCTDCCAGCCTTYNFTFNNFAPPLFSEDEYSTSFANPNVTPTSGGCDWSTSGGRIVKKGNKWRMVIGEATVGGGPTGQPYMVWEANGANAPNACPPTDVSGWALVECDSGSPVMTAIDLDGCPT